MSKTIKIIDLLNKIANGENLPKKILYLDTVFYLIKTEDDFYTYSTNADKRDWERWINNKTNLIRNINETVLILDNEFELIENNTIDIQSIEEYKTKYTERCIDKEVKDKINEIIQAVKQLDKEKTDKKDKQY